MKWYYIVGPEGQTYLIRADSPASAKTRAYTFIQQKWGQFPQGSREANSFAQWAANYGTNADIREFDEETGNQYAKQMPGNVLGGTGNGGTTRPPKPTDPARAGFEWVFDDSLNQWVEKSIISTPPPSDGNTYINENTQTGREAGFQRALKARGVPTGGFAGEYYQDLYDPYEAAFQGELATNLTGIGSQYDPKANQQLFSEYIRNNTNPYGAIATQFRTLLGQGPANVDEQPLTARLINPGSGSIGDAQAFAQQAIQGRLGGYAASLLAPYIRRQSINYAGLPVEGEGATAAPQQNYLQYLRSKLGLGGVQF